MAITGKLGMIGKRFSEICTALSVDEREGGGRGVGAKHNTHRVRLLPERANEHNCLTGFPLACLVFCLSIMSRRPSHAASISIVAMVPSLRFPPIEVSASDTYLDFNTHARALVSPNRTHQSHFLEKITTNAPEERGMAADRHAVYHFCPIS